MTATATSYIVYCILPSRRKFGWGTASRKEGGRFASLASSLAMGVMLMLAACGGGGGTAVSGGGGGTAVSGSGGNGGGGSGESYVLQSFGETTGGIGRRTLMVDNYPAVVSVLDTYNIASLLQSPANLKQKALLLRGARVGVTNNNDLFVWGGTNARPVYNPDNINTIGIEGAVRTSDNLTRVHGFDYPLDSELNTQVYIDAYAPVALAWRSRVGGDIGNVLTIGVPYGGESSLPVGEQTYAGAATLHGDRDGVAGGVFTAFRGGFKLIADFDTANPRVTHFSTEIELGTRDDVTNMGEFAIDLADGTFTGAVKFDASKNTLIRQDATGEIYGQFHGEGATAVSGLYHNGMAGDDLVFGGFAGGNTCIATANTTSPTCP